MEDLAPTGAVLGGFSGAEFAEAAAQMEPGDILAIFTDGLTEAGPDRASLLTADGVAAILRDAPTESAQAVVSHVIAGVDTHAQSGVRDDQCLLVGIAS